MGFPSLFPMAQPVSAEASTTVQRDEGTDEQQKKSPAEGTTDSNGTAEAIAPQKEQQFVGIRVGQIIIVNRVNYFIILGKV
jgi:hypothetical protein